MRPQPQFQNQGKSVARTHAIICILSAANHWACSNHGSAHSPPCLQVPPVPRRGQAPTRATRTPCRASAEVSWRGVCCSLPLMFACPRPTGHAQTMALPTPPPAYRSYQCPGGQAPARAPLGGPKQASHAAQLGRRAAGRLGSPDSPKGKQAWVQASGPCSPIIRGVLIQVRVGGAHARPCRPAA